MHGDHSGQPASHGCRGPHPEYTTNGPAPEVCDMVTLNFMFPKFPACWTMTLATWGRVGPAG